MNNPLINPTRNGKSVPERNTEKRGDGNGNRNTVPSNYPTNSSLLMDDWDYLLYGTEEQYEAHFEPNKKKMRRGMRMCLLLLLLGGTIMTVSSCVCAVYVGLTYHDVHKSYTSMQDMSNPFGGVNASDVEFMKDQMRSINHCISERYCKRINDKNEEDTVKEYDVEYT